MEDHEPTVRSRELGIFLLKTIRAKEWSASYIARVLGWSPSKVSRILTGKRPARAVDIAAFLAVCGVTGPDRNSLLEVARESQSLNWLIEDEDYPSGRMTVLADLESIAATIISVSPSVVPVLLQSERYARALAAHSLPTTRQIDTHVGKILERQKILDRTVSPSCQFFINESTLTQSRLDNSVMSDQAHHLLRLSVRENLRIHILPSQECEAFSEAFQIIDFGDNQIPVVCHETASALHVFERTGTVCAYCRILSKLQDIALDTEDTRLRIRRIAADLASARVNMPILNGTMRRDLTMN